MSGYSTVPSASAKQRVTVPPGLVVVDKPDGMTSHDVVAKVRRIMGTRKVGHAGTLDPMATGVLVLGIERATKLLGHLALDTKAYLATIRLGASTTTDDVQGEVLSTSDPCVRPLAVEEVALAARPVEVSRFDLLATRREDGLELDVMVECSSGTYVRALARDLGADLGVGGHLAALRRTRVGPFDLRVVTTLEKLAEQPALSLPLSDAVAAAFPRRDVPVRQAQALLQGQRLPSAGIVGTYGVFDPEGRAIALAVDEGNSTRSVVVLTTT